MAVIYTKQISEEFTANTDSELTINQTWRVQTNLTTDTAFIIAASPLVPQLFQPHTTAPAKVQSVSPKRLSGSLTHWDVTVTYSNAVNDESENPLKALPEITIETEFGEEEAWVDLDGNPIVNAAFDPYDPPLSRDKPTSVVTVSQNVAVFDEAARLQYANATNSDAFILISPGLFNAIYLPGQCKIKAFSGSNQVQNDVVFWKRVIKFAVRSTDWIARPINQGYQEFYTKYPVEKTIIAASSGGSTFTINDAQSAQQLEAGDEVIVEDTPKAIGGNTNDATYTISSVSAADGKTTIAVGTAPNHDLPGGTLKGPVADGETAKRAIRIGGDEARSPQPLDANGKAILPASLTLANITYGAHQLYPALPFSALSMM